VELRAAANKRLRADHIDPVRVFKQTGRLSFTHELIWQLLEGLEGWCLGHASGFSRLKSWTFLGDGGKRPTDGSV
jgi:hypothetical protein